MTKGSLRRAAAGVVLALTAIVATGAGSVGAAPAGAPGGRPAAGAVDVTNQWIVTLAPGAEPWAVAREHAAAQALEVLHVYEFALTGYAARMSEQAAARIAADPRVLSVQADRQVWATGKPAGSGPQTVPTGINRIDGELSSTVSGNGSGTVNADVAVIDTGIDIDHPDLNVVGGTNCSTGTRYDDGHGHGTHVAGTIGAFDNGSGVVGVAPGVRLHAVRVLNNAGSGSWSSVLCGVDWVTARAGTIEVANMSLGGDGREPAAAGCSTGDALHDGICRSVNAGVTYAVAAGNESDDTGSHVPGAYDEVVTVSALSDFNGQPGGGAPATCRDDVDDTFANFSNYGADVDIIAPGVCITSTWRGGGYNTISGTSMATPHVAGAAALYKASNPAAGPAQVKTALQSAGNLGWNDGDDPDNTKEVLLNVDAF